MINPNTQQEDPNYKPAPAATTDPIATEQPVAGTVPSQQGLINTSKPIPYPDTPTSYTPAKWEVTPDQTVEGRVKGIIEKNSPLMQLADTQAKQEANQRGLLNSSLAVGASQDAMTRAALPIAQADAITAATAGKYGADSANAASQFNITQGQQERERIMQLINNDNKIELIEIEAKYKNQIEQNKGATGLYDTYMRAINNILSGDSPSKTADIRLLTDSLKTGMQMYTDIDNLGIAAIIGGGSSGGGTPPPGSTPPTGGVDAVVDQYAYDTSPAAGDDQMITDLKNAQDYWDKQPAAYRTGPRPEIRTARWTGKKYIYTGVEDNTNEPFQEGQGAN